MLHHLPVATGPYTPGIMDVMLGYTKDSPFVRLYYPTNEKLTLKDQSKKWIHWLPDDSYLAGMARVLMVHLIFLRFAFWWSGKIRIPALYGSKPKIEEKMRCVIMSHGLGGSRFLYSNLCCELASRGFLVAAIEHKDQSACHTYHYSSQSDAKFDKKIPLEFKPIKLGKDHYERRNKQIEVRSDECNFVLDFLIGLQEGHVPYNAIQDVTSSIGIDVKLEDLVGKLDLNSVTMMGHSFGAATALYTLSRRKEFKQGILLDPWMFPIKGEGLEQKVTQPLLFVNTQTFHIASNVDAMSKMMSAEGTEMYTILHSTHENQTDSVLIVGYWLNWFMKKLDALQALRINNSLILTFLNKQINYPKDVKDCEEYLKGESQNVTKGLTQPWA